MKKVAIVGTVGIPACYGGFESLVENLTLNTKEGIQYKVFCSSYSYQQKLSHYNNSELIYIPLKANGVHSILYDIFSLIRCFFLRPDVVLILGVSGCLFLPFFNLFSDSKVITNIDGLEWKRDKWGTIVKKFLKLSEKIAVKFSDVVVTDNQAIADYVKAEYDIDSITIAYGGDHSIRELESKKTTHKPYALGLCRIEPENNVEMILESFSKLTMQLKFVGNWNNSDFGRELKNKYSCFSNIELIDPIYDLDELYYLRSGCTLYLHGHSAGGTNPSLVEMMHFGCPIFAYDCNFNRYSTDNKAHYFKNEKELIELTKYVADIGKVKNGQSMIKLAQERYTWVKIASQYEAIY